MPVRSCLSLALVTLALASPAAAKVTPWDHELEFKTTDAAGKVTASGRLVLQLRNSGDPSAPVTARAWISGSQGESKFTLSYRYTCKDDDLLTPVKVEIAGKVTKPKNVLVLEKSGEIARGVWSGLSLAREENLSAAGRPRGGRAKGDEGGERFEHEVTSKTLFAYHHLFVIQRWKLAAGETRTYDYLDPLEGAFAAGVELKSEGKQQVTHRGAKRELVVYKESKGKDREYWIAEPALLARAWSPSERELFEAGALSEADRAEQAQAAERVLAAANAALASGDRGAYGKCVVSLGAPEPGKPFFPASGVFADLARDKVRLVAKAGTLRSLGSRGLHLEAEARGAGGQSETLYVTFGKVGDEWKLLYLTATRDLAIEKLQEYLAAH
ncbi:MAG: hypothetical protein AB7N76_03930 [Planctomycetota bacterium]